MIHSFPYRGQNIVVDVYSGSVHLLDDPALFIAEQMEKDPSLVAPENSERALTLLLARFEGLKEEEAREILEEVQGLIQDQLLLTEDQYGSLSLDLRDRPVQVKALCLNVAHTCNLDCDYCFASQGKYHGERALMSFEVAKRSIDFLIENSGSHRNLDIDFFGGEPLMNWDVVKKTVEYAESIQEKYHKVFRFTFTTNGVLLNDEVGEFLNRHMHNVVLSLDGRKEVHDRLRHTIGGKGSYDLIVPKFQKFVKSRGDQEYYVRGTFAKNNIDFVKDVIHMANLGFHRLSMEPVIGDPSEPYMLGPDDLKELEHQYDLLTQEMIRRSRAAHQARKEGKAVEDLPLEDQPFVFYHYMLNLEGGPCIYKRISGCGSGTEYMAVTPWGDLYPCHQFVGDEPYRIGTVFDGVKKQDLVNDFKECNCYSRPQCKDCWAKLYCSGGCTANALHASGDIRGTVPFSCDLFRKRMEGALRLKVEELLQAQEEEEVEDENLACS